MLLELSIIPLGRGRSISADIVDLVRIIDASGLDYRLTAAGTIIEGNWDQLMDVARNCHTEMRKKTERVITFMKLDDYADSHRKVDGSELPVIRRNRDHFLQADLSGVILPPVQKDSARGLPQQRF